MRRRTSLSSVLDGQLLLYIRRDRKEGTRSQIQVGSDVQMTVTCTEFNAGSCSCFFRRAVTLEDRMHHIETLIKAIPPAVFAVGVAMPQIASGCPTSESGKALNFVTPFTDPGVPPPSLHVFPLVNPSTHFTRGCSLDSRRNSALRQTTGGPLHTGSDDQLSEEMSKMSLTASYLYFDDEGYTRWQGETSGLPVLDLLVEKRNDTSGKTGSDNPVAVAGAANTDWFPDRQPRRPDIDPQSLWKLIVSHIVPELMDRLVRTRLWINGTDIPQPCAVFSINLFLHHAIPPCTHIPFCKCRLLSCP